MPSSSESEHSEHGDSEETPCLICEKPGTTFSVFGSRPVDDRISSLDEWNLCKDHVCDKGLSVLESSLVSAYLPVLTIIEMPTQVTVPM